MLELERGTGYIGVMEQQPIETFMKAPVPHWLRPKPLRLPSTPPALPSWLSPPAPPTVKPTGEERALRRVQFELAFPFVMEKVCEGCPSIDEALEAYPTPIDRGGFTAWLYKSQERKAMYEEAKIIRAEYWTGLMVKYALGEKTPDTLDRSKTIINTLQWLVSRHSRKEYGDTKTIEMNTTINLRAAMDSAQMRVINATVIEDDDEPVRRLAAPDSEDEEDD